jgi:formamidopyrimidine-DNA glycosylase
MIEIELYRRLADRTVGRRIVDVDAPDPWYLKAGLDAPTVRGALADHVVVGTRRIGKLLLFDTDGPTLGLRFGMTGRLVVDGVDAIDELEYGSKRDLAEWDRFVLRFDGGGWLRMNDPRRLGGVLLDPTEADLGPDALTVTLKQLRGLLAGSEAPLKARLLDQGRIAGLGNLLVDETLWRAGIDPARRARTLDDGEVRRLHRTIKATVGALLEAGGSHLGRLQASRLRGGLCPKDGTPLERRTIGGRTTYSCPRHQR